MLAIQMATTALQRATFVIQTHSLQRAMPVNQMATTPLQRAVLAILMAVGVGPDLRALFVRCWKHMFAHRSCYGTGRLS